MKDSGCLARAALRTDLHLACVQGPDVGVVVAPGTVGRAGDMPLSCASVARTHAVFTTREGRAFLDARPDSPPFRLRTRARWWRTARTKEKRHARAYLGLSAEEGETAGLLRGVLQSPARLAVVPMADWLGLGKAGRINTPGTIGGSNWRWRCEAAALTPKLARHIRTVCERYGRA